MKAAIFDLDGTLVDSMGDITAACNFAMTTLGFRTFTRSQYNDLAGGGNKRLITNTLRAALGREPEQHLIDKGIQLKIQYDNGPKAHAHVEAFPGMHEMLRELQATGIQLAVLSNKTEHLVRAIVNKVFPDIEWKYVAGARDDTPLKPDPTAAIRLVELYMPGIQPQDVVFVGDTPYDIKTALAAGMVPIGVPWGCRPPAELIEEGADKVIKYASEITDYVITEA
eukprot:GFKZ01014937.1.p1 GENE.GFKZ01014937.1~~GFKZ01014937.1.p1  ORF type:complete len:225 (+),score=34.91 GFKZ01014937.1:440-1114(+)